MVSIDCSYPIVILEGQGCRELSSLPIATGNVMATNDHGRNWCTDHSRGERGSGIWHDSCVRIQACQMSGCLRRHSKSIPNGCFGKNDAIVYWIRSYAIIVLMTKTTRLPNAKAWIGSPIIAVNADPSDVSLNKQSPTGNGRNP